jgi:hypothetical protein
MSDPDESQLYKRHLAVTVEGRPCKALIDSGNVWRCAMSRAFYKRLGGKISDLKPAGAAKVATAKAGAHLIVLGEPRQPLDLQVPGTRWHYNLRPVIIEGLSMDLNIAGPFMRKHHWDQLHAQDCLRINNRKIALQEGPGRRSQEKPIYALGADQHPAYLADKTTIPSNSTKMVELVAPDWQRAGEPREDLGLLEGCDEVGGAQTTDGALVTIREGGRILAAVLNPKDHDIVLRAGQKYGRISTANPEPAAPVLAALGGQAPMTTQRKRQEYINQFVAAGRDRAEKGASERPDIRPEKMTEQEKRKWLEDKFQLRDKPCLQEPGALKKAVDLLLEFWDFFSHDGSFGKTHLMKFRIVTEETAPIKCRYRPINPALEPDLRKQLDKWMKEDVIEKSNSPWSFNLVAAKKKPAADGTPRIRWCVDWRRLNEVTRKDAYPMPSVTDNITRLAGSKIFSGIDMQGAFHVLEIEEADREKTAFATPFGSFQQKRLGFGLTNGPSAYCRLVERVLQGIPTSMAVGFLDDGVVHSETLSGHLSNLRVVLSAYQAAGLKLSPDKCTFFANEIEYLGHTVNQEGVRPTGNHVQAIQEWKLPRYKTEARAFLGATGYYRLHIRDYAKLAQPWTDVVGKTDKEAEKTPLKVTKEMELSFKQLKERLITRPVLGFPYFQGPKAGQFILDTDFSTTQIAGILSQKQQAKEVVIAYGSKKLNKSQRSYPSTKGELMAGMYFMVKFRYYLQYGAKFLWRTDNSALKYVKTMDCPSAIIARWLTTMADFNFDVQYREGTKHGNADGLSRNNSAAAYMDLDEDRMLAEIVPLYKRAKMLPYTKEELRQLQNEDPELSLVRTWMANEANRPDSLQIRTLGRVAKIYAGLLDSLQLSQDGLITYYVPNQQLLLRKQVVCLPRDLWEETIQQAHETLGHQGRRITLEELRKHVFFPGMRAEVEAALEACLACQTKNQKQKDQRHTLISVGAGYPFQRICIDHVGPLSEGNLTKSRYILTVHDVFTKWIEAFPVRSISAEETARVLEREIFTRFGLPETIHADCAKAFQGHLFQELGQLLAIQITNTTGYNPKSNPVERRHRDLGNILRAILEDQPNNWEEALPQALFAMRTAVNSAIGLAPYQVLFGRDVSQPLDTIFQLPEDNIQGEATHRQYLRELQKRMRAAAKYAQENMAEAVRRQRRQYHQDKKHFLPGQKVWLFTPRTKPGASRKLSSYWTGPWTIAANNDKNSLIINIVPDQNWETPTKMTAVSIDRLKPYKGPAQAPPDEDCDIEMAGDEFAEGPIMLPNIPQPHAQQLAQALIPQQPQQPQPQAPPPQPPQPPQPPPAPQPQAPPAPPPPPPRPQPPPPPAQPRQRHRQQPHRQQPQAQQPPQRQPPAARRDRSRSPRSPTRPQQARARTPSPHAERIDRQQQMNDPNFIPTGRQLARTPPQRPQREHRAPDRYGEYIDPDDLPALDNLAGWGRDRAGRTSRTGRQAKQRNKK